MMGCPIFRDVKIGQWVQHLRNKCLRCFLRPVDVIFQVPLLSTWQFLEDLGFVQRAHPAALPSHLLEFHLQPLRSIFRSQIPLGQGGFQLILILLASNSLFAYGIIPLLILTSSMYLTFVCIIMQHFYELIQRRDLPTSAQSAMLTDSLLFVLFCHLILPNVVVTDVFFSLHQTANTLRALSLRPQLRTCLSS